MLGNEKYKSRVFIYGAIAILVSILAAFTQVSMLKRFFIKKKIV